MPDEYDFEGYVARFTEALDTGEVEVPAPSQEQTWFSVAGTDDPRVLQAEAFAQHGPLDEAEPGGLLGAQAANVADDPVAMGAMSDNALLGLVAAGRRLSSRAAAIQQRAIAEFARRRTPAPGTKASRQGFTEFSADELAWSLVINHNQAEAAMVLAGSATRRLPRLCRLLWDGTVSATLVVYTF
jgi:hypothetical protein